MFTDNEALIGSISLIASGPSLCEL